MMAKCMPSLDRAVATRDSEAHGTNVLQRSTWCQLAKAALTRDTNTGLRTARHPHEAAKHTAAKHAASTSGDKVRGTDTRP